MSAMTDDDYKGLHRAGDAVTLPLVNNHVAVNP
jgi:hypothetical protein